MAGGASPDQVERRAGRRQAFQDAYFFIIIGAIIALSSWALWRLDDRSERLFNVVATARACPTTCPGSP